MHLMTAPASPSKQLYLAWVEQRIEDFKDSISRDELLEVADDAVQELYAAPEGQYSLTEIVLRDAVDMLLFRRLGLPTYKQWLKLCQIDTPERPPESTAHGSTAGARTA
jgi:hypothetical protein